MSVQFLFGISGSGKSEYLIRRALREAYENLRDRYLFIVPEQETLCMQERVVSHRDNRGRGILNIDVLSFNRLAYRVFQELNKGIPRIIDDSGKVMILRETSAKVSSELLYYKEQLGRPGFISELKSQISELYQYRILPEMLDEVAEGSASKGMMAKLHDLALLYRAFRVYMEEHGYLTQEELPDRLLELLPESRLLDDCTIFFDGFTGFTPVQLDILEELMPRARELCFALDVRGEEMPGIYDIRGTEELFYLSRQTVRQLTERASRQGVKLLRHIDLNQNGQGLYPRFVNAPALQYLAEEIYRYKEPERTAPASIKNIELWEARDIRTELEFAAERIEEELRERGRRYSDIGIMLTVPDEYRDLVFRVFSSAGIPYFLDDGSSLLDSPYAEHIRSALLVLEKGFSFDSVIRFLRSLPVKSEAEENETDIFENYLRASGKRGIGKYKEEWEEYNELKNKLIQPLIRLSSESGRGSSVGERTEALKALLRETGARERLLDFAERQRLLGQQNLAEELSRGVERIDELLDRMSELLSDTVVSRKEFTDILDSGLGEERLRIIPATKDRVLIGDLTRSRFSSPSLFMILGASTDNLPKGSDGSGILGDRERALFKERGIELAPSKTDNALIERFYIYRALATPSERLILSYPLRGRGAKGMKPSSVMEKLLRLFPDQRIHSLKSGKKTIYNVPDALRYLACELPEYLESKKEGREYSADSMLLYLRLLRETGDREQSERLIRAMLTHYENTSLSEAAAKAVYGELLEGSITRLEQFNQCAYAHFLRYGLRLNERKSYEIQAVDIGNLYHRAIELCFRDAERRKKAIQELTEAELNSMAEQAVSQCAAESRGISLLSSGRNQYILRKTEDITKTTLWALSEQLRRGDFRTVELEKSFELVREGLRLRGRIDRVDSYEEDNKVYVKIIDYKSGRAEFSLQRVYEGLQLQLVSYMDVMLKNLEYRNPGKQIIPAAMVYYHIDSPVLDYKAGRSRDELLSARLKALRVDGLVNSERELVEHLDREIVKESEVVPVYMKDGEVDVRKKSVTDIEGFSALRSFTEKKMLSDARKIMDGMIELNPIRESRDRTACSYCPYHSICGFDPRMDGYSYRSYKKADEEEIWEAVKKEDKIDGNEVDKGAGEDYRA